MKNILETFEKYLTRIKACVKMVLPTRKVEKMQESKFMGTMVDEVKEFYNYCNESGRYETANECKELLELFTAKKMVLSDWQAMKRLAEQNRLLKTIGEIALY